MSTPPHREDDPPIKISRNVSQTVVGGVGVAIIVAILLGTITMRDSIHDLMISNAQLVAVQTTLVAGQARIEGQLAQDRSEKLIVDQRQDFEIDDINKRTTRLEHGGKR